ncbi:hydrolase [Microtetraspora sp. NBRC 13810]|uniref:phytase n=1 Tax=Microtetraspora sp. NBRC 13810 TaxID=3030990 RepID=UPI0024A45AD3|nr:phytase [Microtetraspora sp. NBRC 13810]GLW11255.1 hydrolase [Microtetraspora sp. NBRC 13810]
MRLRLAPPLVMTSALLTALVAAPPATADRVPVVTARAETPALFDDAPGGNANGDDPAIWVHPAKPGSSVVVATAKEGGLFAYDLKGGQLQHVPAPPAPGADDEPGRFNNVDLVYRFGGRDLAVVSDRGRDQLRFYAIDPAAAAGARAPLTDVTDPAAPFVFNAGQEEVNEARTAYGVATWKDRTGVYALVSRRHETSVALVRLKPVAGGKVGYEVVRTLTLPSSFRLPDGTTWTPCLEPGELPQVEGMVVDAERDVLYAAQEDVGVWRLPADLTGRPELVDRVREYGVPGTYDPETEECDPGPDPGFGGTHLAADAEGLTIYYHGDGTGYLLASGQGDDTFTVYRREGRNAYVGQFRVGSGRVDGAEASDGAMAVNVPLGDAYDKGLFVTHDGVNTPEARDDEGEVRENTDFKFVRWDDIARKVGLRVDTRGWDPRAH